MSTSRTVAVFVAHSKHDTDESIELAVNRLKAKFENETTKLHVTLGREDHNLNFRRCGSWSAWTKNVVYGTRFGTNVKRYEIIYAPSLIVGKATKEIIEHAITAKTRVIAYVESLSSFRNIAGVGDNASAAESQFTFGEKSWKDGWRLKYE